MGVNARECILGNMKVEEFEKYYRSLYRPLCMYALRLTKDIYVSEDVVQDSFASMWHRLQGTPPPDNFKSYAYTTVRNTALMASRTPNRTEAIDETYANLPEEEAIDTSERDARIWASVEKLPTKRRKILLMNKRDGMSYGDIASQLGISVKTVENQLGKAYKSIREAGVKLYLFLFA